MGKRVTGFILAAVMIALITRISAIENIASIVGDGMLEIVVLGRIPGTELQISYFALMMTMLVTFMIASLWYKSFIGQFTIFRLKKNREDLRKPVIIEPEMNTSGVSELEEAAEELEPLAT